MGFPTTPILDNFNRANEALEVSANWAELASGLDIVSNEVKGSNTSGSNAAGWVGDTFNKLAQESFAKVTVKPLTGEQFFAFARLDGGFDGYAVNAITETGADNMSVVRLDAGVGTVLDTSNMEFSVGDSIGIRSVGDEHQLWYHDGSSWTKLASELDSTHKTQGDIGLILVNDTVQIDDFGGGNFDPPQRIMWFSELINFPNLILAGIFGVIVRNPKMTKREILNLFKWFDN